MEQHSLNERVKKIRKDNKLTQAEFAKQIGVTQGNLSLIESGKTIVNVETIKILKKKFQLSYNWLLEGKPLTNTLDHGTPLVDLSAMAGYPANHTNKNYLDTLAVYRIPGFVDGEYRIFEVEGESMVPTLLPHDYIIASEIEKIEKMVDGALTAVILKDGVLVKRISKLKRNTFLLESDNLHYKPLKVKKEDILGLWAVRAKITQSLQNTLHSTDKKFKDLEEKIEKIEKQMQQAK